MPRIVIFVESGVVTEVLCSEPTEILLIDQDVQDEEKAIQFTVSRLHRFLALTSTWTECGHPKATARYFNQAKERRS